MTFDLCEHRIRQIAIKAGQEIRKAKGLPEESNVTILFNEVAPLLGLSAIQLNTKQHGRKLPAPHEMTNRDGRFIVPRKDCPQCGRKDGLSLKSLCGGCTDSEGGKYHTMFSCDEIIEKQRVGCGFKTDKSEKFMAQRLSELNPNWEGGIKEGLGIKTITDDGIK